MRNKLVVRSRNVLKRKCAALRRRSAGSAGQLCRRSERSSDCKHRNIMIRFRASTDRKSATSK